jgi:hypothetical protein
MSNNTEREDFFRLESLRLACNMATANTGILENAEKYYEWLLNEPKTKKNTRKTSSK